MLLIVSALLLILVILLLIILSLVPSSFNTTAAILVLLDICKLVEFLVEGAKSDRVLLRYLNTTRPHVTRLLTTLSLLK